MNTPLLDRDLGNVHDLALILNNSFEGGMMKWVGRGKLQLCTDTGAESNNLMMGEERATLPPLCKIFLC